MHCENCNKNPATVHVTEIPQEGDEAVQQNLCDVCAAQHDLPHNAAQPKSISDIWKLLQISAQKAAQRRKTVECEACGMSLEELRRKGRLGCPQCYEVFQSHLVDLFEGMHGAREHVGRLPGGAQAGRDKAHRIDSLREELEVAIREEAYERAASIRDELRTLEAEPST